MPTPDQQPHRATSFPTTSWSLILDAGSLSAEGRGALAELCQAYWYPVYAFMRRRSCDAARAEDLTQEFFARLLEKNYLHDADRNRGRFRTFLLTAASHFVANEWDRRQARKRGGDTSIVSIDAAMANHRYSLEPADTDSPEVLYEKSWAAMVIERVLEAIRLEAASKSKSRQYDRLKVFLAGGDSTPYSQVAAELEMSEGAVKVAVHRLRENFKVHLRSEIGRTVKAENEIDAEIRYLLRVMRS
jgi:RNA polymerase sigma-70 factor (ECF subfamily)